MVPTSSGAEPRQGQQIVLAAGGLVLRRSAYGWPEIAVVHRPAKRDWSFPKGKLELSETFEQCALREVHEETGLCCDLGVFVGHTAYRDRNNRHKVVAYWVMHPVSGTFQPNNEVDDVVWAGPDAAGQLLTYPHDRELVAVVASEASLLPT